MNVRRLYPYILIAMLLVTVFASAQDIPAGTRITVRVGSELNSGKATVGQGFDATLTNDIVVNGKVIAKSGSPVRGKVTGVKSSGRIHAPGVISVRLTSLSANGKTYALRTSSVSRQGGSHTKSNATKIGGGAVAGAVLGGIFGGGKGAAIGAGAGAAAGTGVAAATGKKEAVIPAESALTFTTSVVTNAAKKN
jgi:hypothetical protein